MALVLVSTKVLGNPECPETLPCLDKAWGVSIHVFTVNTYGHVHHGIKQRIYVHTDLGRGSFLLLADMKHL